MSKLLELLDSVSTNPTVISITLVIWSIVLGIIIALSITFYQKRVIGSFFRALIKENAVDAESAKNIREISQTENDAVISKLKRSSSFRKMVTIVNENGSDTVDENTKFYLSEAQLIRVRDQWGEKKENVGVLIGGIVGTIILGILVTIVIVLNLK